MLDYYWLKQTSHIEKKKKKKKKTPKVHTEFTSIKTILPQGLNFPIDEFDIHVYSST
jgi:hypothetical protein